MDGHATGQSNVIPLNALQFRQPLPQRLAAHARLFAEARRGEGDVFWLKENAEFLSVLRSAALPGEPVLDTYAAVYAGLGQRLADFPQYYRFHLSICLDLEDLGMPGDKGAALCDWAAAQDLAGAELSDLQRAEARRLLARRGVRIADAGLTDRLHRFVERPQTFAIPNLKAAYELTHIAFYLSDYGRKDPQFGPGAIRSLTYAGLLAVLDQNHDLLAEICIALRFAGRTPPAAWDDMVRAALHTTRDQPSGPGDLTDDYHTYLMTGWRAALTDGPVLPLTLRAGPRRISLSAPTARPLRAMSRLVRDLRSGDWGKARWRIMGSMDPPDRCILETAERSTPHFADFYDLFARTSAPAS